LADSQCILKVSLDVKVSLNFLKVSQFSKFLSIFVVRQLVFKLTNLTTSQPVFFRGENVVVLFAVLSLSASLSSLSHTKLTALPRGKQVVVLDGIHRLLPDTLSVPLPAIKSPFSGP